MNSALVNWLPWSVFAVQPGVLWRTNREVPPTRMHKDEKASEETDEDEEVA